MTKKLRRTTGTTAATLGAVTLVLSMGLVFALPSNSAYATGVREGCTPGFWKTHTEEWVGYTPDQQFSDVFGFEVPGYEDLTLLEALSISGSGEYSLIREGTAALLNAAHPDVNFKFSESTVISKVRDGADPIFDSNIIAGNDVDWELQKTHLEEANERICPF